ncbi:MAG: response regulator [Eubacterium sp.]|nr:response regulator [Eubacterium sp.]
MAVVLLTGYSWEDKLEEALIAGVDEVISKLLFKDNLIHSIQTILLRREKPAEEKNDPDQSDLDIQSNHMLKCRRILVVKDMFSDHPMGYYDAILMDVRMPVMNGLDATRAIRELERADAGEIPIIAMTANAFDEDVQISLQAGMDAHLSKPVEPELLYETLDRLIQHK